MKTVNIQVMARPKLKTVVTTLKMTPEVKDLWERCAAHETRSLTNMFEIMVKSYAKKLKLDTTQTDTPGNKQ